MLRAPRTTHHFAKPRRIDLRPQKTQGARRRSCPPPFGLLLYLALAYALGLLLLSLVLKTDWDQARVCVLRLPDAEHGCSA